MTHNKYNRKQSLTQMNMYTPTTHNRTHMPTRKEIFGRQHNTQPGWVTLGNQLDGVHLVEPECKRRFARSYPDGL